MATNKKIESVHLESFLYFIIESIVNSLNVGIIALEHLQSSQRSVNTRYLQRLHGNTQTDYCNPPPTHSG